MRLSHFLKAVFQKLTVVISYPIHGKLDSVNPIALKKKGEIFIENERYVSILETNHFGKLAYIEVGATMVGKIVQSHDLKTFNRGEEKGYFEFGGSCLVMLFEKDKIELDHDLVENSLKGYETKANFGESLGKAL